jgi:hypothetical protein
MRHISILEAASCAILMGLVPLFGQGITLSGTGYTDPSIIRVAPGQITTLFVTGLKTVLTSTPLNGNVIVVQPAVTEDGKKAPGLKFGQPRVMALLLALTMFHHLIDGFRNRRRRRILPTSMH